jgi:hypothetical protein
LLSTTLVNLKKVTAPLTKNEKQNPPLLSMIIINSLKEVVAPLEEREKKTHYHQQH